MQPQSLYEELKEAGLTIDSHESDLYVPVCDRSTMIIDSWEQQSKNANTFTGSDGRLWYDVPFAYDPWWVAQVQA